MALAVANRYAAALADVVLAPGSGVVAELALAQLRDFCRLLADSAELRGVLMSPAIPPPRKRAVVSRLGERLGLAPRIRNFLFVVIDRRRIAALDEITDAFRAALDERLGRARAEVASASALAEPRRSTLEGELARLSGKQVRCEYQVEPALLGGVSVRIGSTIYDGSVRGRLEALRKRMAAG